MKPLDIPAELPPFLKEAFDELTDAVGTAAEKHGLTNDELIIYFGTGFARLIADNGQTEHTVIMNTTLPVRVGLLDAHEDSIERMDMVDRVDDETVLRATNKLTAQVFSNVHVARNWLKFYLCTNKDDMPKQPKKTISLPSDVIVRLISVEAIDIEMVDVGVMRDLLIDVIPDRKEEFPRMNRLMLTEELVEYLNSIAQPLCEPLNFTFIDRTVISSLNVSIACGRDVELDSISKAEMVYVLSKLLPFRDVQLTHLSEEQLKRLIRNITIQNRNEA